MQSVSAHEWHIFFLLETAILMSCPYFWFLKGLQNIIDIQYVWFILLNDWSETEKFRKYIHFHICKINRLLYWFMILFYLVFVIFILFPLSLYVLFEYGAILWIWCSNSIPMPWMNTTHILRSKNPIFSMYLSMVCFFFFLW